MTATDEEDLRHGRKLLADALRRENNEDFYSGRKLHLWNAVLVTWTTHDRRPMSRVLLAENWDHVRTVLFAVYGPEHFTVYDGRELFG